MKQKFILQMGFYLSREGFIIVLEGGVDRLKVWPQIGFRLPTLRHEVREDRTAACTQGERKSVSAFVFFFFF